MSDKELEEYINKIEPNFNSHLEKGTIEMSNEYYNLLEEKMVRLINKNQELKSQLKGTTHCFDEEEHEKLKKQIETYEIEGYKQNEELDKMSFSIKKYKTQQKEFIKYMNDIIEDLETEDVDDEEMKGYLIQRIDTFKEILQKYKSIIGVSDDKK